MDELSATVAGGVLSVTINRPEHLNTLTVPVLAGLADVLEAAAADQRVKVVRLSGAGRSFSAGASMKVDDWHGAGAAIDITVQANRAVRAVTAMPQPVVAVVQGPVAGNGVSLALACDLVVASERAVFTMGVTKVGLMPDAGASALLAAAAGRARAMRMVLLNERLTAAQVAAWGLIAAVCPHGELEAETNRIIELLLSGPAPAFAKTKAAINAVALADLEPALQREMTGQAELVRTNDFIEGATAFLQRRPAAFTGT
ncbi:enoyl-CoA hydratase-related protein [Mycobacterium asiaticum]|uniref:Enoyl-CoA hydratase n=1 Tax=Mycobacterium asiaticum TaxID=1790 RepID=A0A1A3N7S8_MYCAS|nr:enoyl-CoA hydratase-related protein [Mycobacterium asiaticum]OBK17390.1 enoyl-CoA hydratase [Mycobacterium asiaticum]OBK96993.1 enoyl-CoA hydratase [Mycobacterium asiaticum]